MILHIKSIGNADVVYAFYIFGRFAKMQIFVVRIHKKLSDNSKMIEQFSVKLWKNIAKLI